MYADAVARLDLLKILINIFVRKWFEYMNFKISGLNSIEKSKMLDITRDKPIKVAVRVAVPVRDHPKVNIVHLLTQLIFHLLFIVQNSILFILLTYNT